MAKPQRTVERALKQLQQLVRSPPSDPPEPSVLSFRVPEDLQAADLKTLLMFDEEHRALEHVQLLLTQDLRFEHLADRDVTATTRRFVALAHVHRKDDHVAAFVNEHAREPMKRTCFFPLDLLTVAREMTLYDATFFPPGAVDAPAYTFAEEAGPAPTSVLGVPCVGTSYKNMVARSRLDAERVLRLLRATLRAHNWLPDIQLRFRLGYVYWFSDAARGWTSPLDRGADLELTEELLRLATSQDLSTLPATPANDVEERVARALVWFERAQLAVDPLMELLALFFALETILGDRSEDLKAQPLALRRAMLGLLTSGHFAHPSAIYSLYDEVRSKAVHGEQPPEVSQRDVDSFAWDVRLALNEYLQYARDAGFTRRRQIRQALDTHERREWLAAKLMEQDPKRWSTYLGTGADAGPDRESA